MVKIKIYELDKHRNETTFRPYLMARDTFREIGIEFTEGDSYDFAWIGQASIVDKSLPLDESVNRGVDFMRNVGGMSMIFDGQDSHSLIGTFEVFRTTQILSSGICLLLMKNTLLCDFSMYKEPRFNGRWYWGQGNYYIPDIDMYSDKIVLSGTNWLSTFQPNFFPIDHFKKTHDVCALFGSQLTYGREHDIDHYVHYNHHRDQCLQKLSGMRGTDIQRLHTGQRLSPEVYHRVMATSKIVVAPFGYGEMAPRDLQAMSYGSVLIKPSMDHLKSEPWIYDEGRSYIGCRHDFEDLPEKIDYVLANYKSLRKEMYDYSIDAYMTQYADPTRLPTYIHELFTNKLSGIVSHENTNT